MKKTLSLLKGFLITATTKAHAMKAVVLRPAIILFKIGRFKLLLTSTTNTNVASWLPVLMNILTNRCLIMRMMITWWITKTATTKVHSDPCSTTKSLHNYNSSNRLSSLWGLSGCLKIIHSSFNKMVLEICKDTSKTISPGTVIVPWETSCTSSLLPTRSNTSSGFSSRISKNNSKRYSLFFWIILINNYFTNYRKLMYPNNSSTMWQAISCSSLISGNGKGCSLAEAVEALLPVVRRVLTHWKKTFCQK